jgi:periplasmic divalent cation tolerance protein
MSEEGKIVVFITTGTEEEAHTIARELVNQKVAACVNIVPGVDSTFRWEGKIESDRESLLIVKTTLTLLPETINLVKQVHSYTVPEIIAMPIIGGNPEYLQWVGDELKR